MRRKNETIWNLLKTFPIGTHVVVSAKMWDDGQDVMRTDHGLTNRTHRWAESPCSPFIAWVTGATWKCDGEVFPEESVGFSSWDGVTKIPTGFKVTRKTPVVLVRVSTFSREIAVPATAVQRVIDGSVYGGTQAPLVVSHKQPWLTERDREEMRTMAAAMPRDPKGRFLKKV